MTRYTGTKMRATAIRKLDANPKALGDGTLVHEWHITMYEVRVEGEDELFGYRLHTGEIMDAKDVVLEPGRKGAFCADCAQGGPLPKG